MAVPEVVEATQLVSLTAVNAPSSGKVAMASTPMLCFWPFVYFATTEPSSASSTPV